MIYSSKNPTILKLPYLLVKRYIVIICFTVLGLFSAIMSPTFLLSIVPFVNPIYVFITISAALGYSLGRNKKSFIVGGLAGAMDYYNLIRYNVFLVIPILGSVAGYVEATKRVGKPVGRINYWRNVFKKPKTLQKKSILKITQKPLSKMKILKTIS